MWGKKYSGKKMFGQKHIASKTNVEIVKAQTCKQEYGSAVWL